ncbi:MAG: MarR family transcriptional regulator [Thermomicrobiales bacterium]|nr:MarR family transcriptional regulator [Thermomicrobiales bacterium]
MTDEQLRIWRDYIETADKLRSELGRRLQQDSSLSTGDYAVMLALSEAEGRRMRSSELATVVGWERSRLSHHLGRMEKRGLIRREECAADTRGAEIVLVPAGFEAFRRAVGPHLAAVDELFIAALSEEELAAAAILTHALRARLDRERSTAPSTA